MKARRALSYRIRAAGVAAALVIVGTMIGLAAGQVNKDSSYLPVVPKEDFAATMSRMKAAKAKVLERQKASG